MSKVKVAAFTLSGTIFAPWKSDEDVVLKNIATEKATHVVLKKSSHRANHIHFGCDLSLPNIRSAIKRLWV